MKRLLQSLAINEVYNSYCYNGPTLCALPLFLCDQDRQSVLTTVATGIPSLVPAVNQTEQALGDSMYGVGIEIHCGIPRG